MLNMILWFAGIILSVFIIHLLISYLKSLFPGQGKTYILQPFYRLMKLASKKNAASQPLIQWFSAGALWFSLTALWLTVSGWNIVYIFSILIIAELFIIAGASGTNNSFGLMAVQRRISGFSITCFTLMVAASSIYKVTGTLNLGGILTMTRNKLLILRLPFTFISMIMVILVEEGVCWFDLGISGKSMSFIDTGLYSAYNGWCLAVIQLTQWVKTGIWLKFISVFLPWPQWISFTVSILIYAVLMVSDAFVAKTGWKKAVLNGFIWAGGASVINYIWLYLANI
ncbi:MAG: hypothetical protein GX045_07950 [Clostridiaceae bacterium]|nr:hypothetical protein [Clostridiaceae bacterium]